MVSNYAISSFQSDHDMIRYSLHITIYE